MDTRFIVLETIRQFAGQLLQESGLAEVTQRAHAAYFLALAQSAEGETLHLGVHPQLALLDADDDNLRAALSWSLAQGEQEIALRLGVALGGYWITRSRLREGAQWLGKLLHLSRCPEFPQVNARLHVYLGRLYEMLGDYPRSRALLERGLALARATNDPTEIALALSYLGITTRTMGESATARAFHQESADLYAALDDRYGLVMAVKDIGLCDVMQARYDAAELRFTEAWRLSTQLNDAFIDAYLLGKLGHAVLMQERTAEAKELLGGSIDRFRSLKPFEEFSAMIHILHGQALLAEGEADAALASTRAGLRIWAATDTFWGTVFALSACARIMAERGRLTEAWRLVAFATHAMEQSGAALHSMHQGFHNHVQTQVRAVLDETAAAAWQAGTHMTLQDALRIAFAEPETNREHHERPA
ncbi:MAG: hypothetical protein H6644_11495 [Caldilineaceae bacterium]|nr:hypothetical protein [Caldilineaceae bacterium]